MHVKIMLINNTEWTCNYVVDAAIVAWSRLKMRFQILLGS